MTVTVVPDPGPVGNDQVEMRAEQVRLCRLFNAKYADGIESPRRRALRERIERILPELRTITLEARAVCEGERKRLGEAQDRMAEKEVIPDIDVDLIDTVDPRTKEIWECCESLYWDAARRCRYCGEPGIPSSSLDDVEGVMTELVRLLGGETAVGRTER